MPPALFPDRSKQSIAQRSVRGGTLLAPNERTTNYSAVGNDRL
jgi:hypothetical protein